MSINFIKNLKLILLILYLFFFSTNHSHAYLGLAPLIPLIGQGILYVVIFLIFVAGLILYPLKKLINRIRKKKSSTKDNTKDGI
tara:strand:- start:26 stop:277 length:252 start_codon:yes stop_codon:yes gene_type:complete